MEPLCPFTQIFGDDVKCQYIDEKDHCIDGMYVNCGNSDAWCTNMIEKSLTHDNNV